MSNWTLPRTTVSMFRERREIEGLRGDRGEVVLVEGAGLATADGIFRSTHRERGKGKCDSIGEKTCPCHRGVVATIKAGRRGCHCNRGF